MELEVRDQSWVFRARQAVQERLGLGLLATRLLASETELSLFYLPSMRNGLGAEESREDRGNA